MCGIISCLCSSCTCLNACVTNCITTSKNNMQTQYTNIVNNYSNNDGHISSILSAIILFIVVCYSAFRVSSKRDLVLNNNNIENANSDSTTDNFSYTFYFIIYAIASTYVAMLITNWIIYRDNIIIKNSTIIPNHGIQSMIVKIISALVIHLLYIWSLVAPIIFPDRDFSQYPSNF